MILINRWGKGVTSELYCGKEVGCDQGNYYRISIHGRVRASGLPHVLPYPLRQTALVNCLTIGVRNREKDTETLTLDPERPIFMYNQPQMPVCDYIFP